MTENQKRRITLMRQNHVGYAAIANELKLSLSTVKTFCRRNNLQAGDLASDTQPGNIAETPPGNDLISAGSRGNRDGDVSIKKPGDWAATRSPQAITLMIICSMGPETSWIPQPFGWRIFTKLPYVPWPGSCGPNAGNAASNT